MGRKYAFRTKPYKHQILALRKLMRSPFGGALLMDPRTGKTKTAIDYLSMQHLKHGTDRVLVVCPSRVMGVWLEEISRHSPYLCNVIIWDAKARKIPLARLVDHDRYDINIVVVNYEAFGQPGKKLPSGKRSKTTGRFKYRSEIRKWIGDERAICILDESHKIKKPSGKAAMMLVSMRGLFTERVLMTGTVVTKAKRAHDIYMQWKFLNPARFADLELSNADDFRNYFGRWIQDNGYDQWVAPRHLGELHRRIHMDSFAVHREDCFDLPPREDIVETVKLTGETARVYDEMATEMVALIKDAKAQAKSGEIDKFVEANIALVQTLRLAQITGGCATDTERVVHRIGVDKLKALSPHLEDAYERDEKLVICARFKADLNAIALACEEHDLPVWQLRGGVKRADSDRFIREFRKHDGAGVFIVQPQSGSLGIDLSSASKMIWFSLTQSYVDFTQCCDRIALSRNSTTFIFLLAQGTVDEVMYEALKGDGDVAKAITSSPEKLLRSNKSRKLLTGRAS